jgi:transketolase
MALQTDILEKAANEARGLAIDAVHACNSGHLGLPLGCAEVGAVLFGNALSLNPDEPRWLNRDRFVLSAGHGSMFLYSWLHLSGFDLPIEQIEKFRTLHSMTPGHPEFRDTPGVEATTGPWARASATPSAWRSRARWPARFNTPEHPIFDYHVVCLAGDGCMQEGVGDGGGGVRGPPEARQPDPHLRLEQGHARRDGGKTQSENTAAALQGDRVGRADVDGYDMPAS